MENGKTTDTPSESESTRPVAAGSAPAEETPEFDLRAYIRTTLWQMAACFVVYVLSIGPLYWQWYSSMYLNGPSFYAKLYYPLYLLAGLIPPFGEFLNWYVELWMG
jgi:hypothetical protein